MITLHPMLVGLAVLAFLASLGVAYVRRIQNFSGYKDIEADVLKIQKSIKGEIFRDGNDLVIGGNQGKYPVTVRFSYDEQTPGLNIRMGAPANFGLVVAPRGQNAGEGKVMVRTGDDMFDARFVTRSDQPAQAKMFLGGRKAMALIQKLSCSNKTFVTVAARSLELSELIIPTPYTGPHVIDHVQKMEQLCGELAAMPEAEKVKIAQYQREGSNAARYLIYGLLAVSFVSFGYSAYEGAKEKSATPSPQQALPSGFMPVDANVVQGLAHWKVATSDVYDPTAMAWLRDNLGSDAITGRLTADFDGSGNNRDVAYALVYEDGSMWRIILLANGKNIYDLRQPKVGVIARFPKGNAASTEWEVAPPANILGDGLLVIEDAFKPNGSKIIFLIPGDRFIAARPADYRKLNLR